VTRQKKWKGWRVRKGGDLGGDNQKTKNLDEKRASRKVPRRFVYWHRGQYKSRQGVFVYTGM